MRIPDMNTQSQRTAAGSVLACCSSPACAARVRHGAGWPVWQQRSSSVPGGRTAPQLPPATDESRGWAHVRITERWVAPAQARVSPGKVQRGAIAREGDRPGKARNCLRLPFQLQPGPRRVDPR